jgi:hypothetical protein
VSAGDYSIVKIELSLGKQTFNMSSSNYPPSQFQVPDVCLDDNGKVFGEFIHNARFIDKLSDSAIDQARKVLIEDGFEAAPDGDAENKSVDIYWKNLESKRRVMTKLHCDDKGTVIRLF